MEVILINVTLQWNQRASFWKMIKNDKINGLSFEKNHRQDEINGLNFEKCNATIHLTKKVSR